MIILSAGMQKSGSAWYFNLINDMLIAAGNPDVRTVREQFGLHPVLQFHNCNIGNLSPENLRSLLAPHYAGCTFVVKTHSGPTPEVASLMARNILKATYIYRDPRDVIVSAMDHGRKIRKEGDNHTFAAYDTLEKAVVAVKEWLDIAGQWMSLETVFCVRYEDLLAQPAMVLQRVAEFLEIDMTHDSLTALLAAYHKEQLSGSSIDFLHFNKGVSQRFRSVMSGEQQSYCLRHLAESIHRMGYRV